MCVFTPLCAGGPGPRPLPRVPVAAAYPPPPLGVTSPECGRVVNRAGRALAAFVRARYPGVAPHTQAAVVRAVTRAALEVEVRVRACVCAVCVYASVCVCVLVVVVIAALMAVTVLLGVF